MSKQDEFNELMEMIHRHYSAEKIEEYKSYSNMVDEDAPKVTITVNTNTYGN